MHKNIRLSDAIKHLISKIYCNSKSGVRDKISPLELQRKNLFSKLNIKYKQRVLSILNFEDRYTLIINSIQNL